MKGWTRRQGPIDQMQTTARSIYPLCNNITDEGLAMTSPNRGSDSLVRIGWQPPIEAISRLPAHGHSLGDFTVGLN